MRSVFYVIIRTLLVIPAKLLFRVKVIGRKNEPRVKEGAYLVCGNHQTALDAVFTVPSVCVYVGFIFTVSGVLMDCQKLTVSTSANRR